MALIEPLRAARVVHIDTAPIIYLIERHPRYFDLIAPVVEAIESGEMRAISSYVTLLEVLVKPFERGAIDLVDRYRTALLGQRNLEVFELGSDVAEDAARIRALHGFDIADCVQLATACLHGADTFLTNDMALERFADLRVVVLEHHAIQ
jgi:predicted nucleic acid-binding protein